jgi:DNA relaxase NicK
VVTFAKFATLQRDAMGRPRSKNSRKIWDLWDVIAWWRRSKTWALPHI